MSSGENSFRVVGRKDGGLCMEKNGWTFDLAAPEIVKLALPPYVKGVDWFIKEAAKIKGISSKDMRVSFNESFFIGCDASLHYDSPHSGGWIYKVRGEGVKADELSMIWICRKMQDEFKKPPSNIFTLLEDYQ